MAARSCEEVEQGLAARHSHYHKWPRCLRYLLRSPSARCTTRSCRTRCSSSSRAPTFETEPILSASSDGRLAIEPSDDPCALVVRWFGTRYILRVPERRPFTEQETRFARAIGSVLAARYRAILNPKLMIDRGELFRGAIEDRYVGAFLDNSSYEVSNGRAARGPHRVGHRGAARRCPEQLREPSDLDRRAAARHRAGSRRTASTAAAGRALLHAGAHRA